MKRLAERYLGREWTGAGLAAVLLMATAFLFGGASRQHELRLALVEIAAIPLLVLAVQAMSAKTAQRPSNLYFGLILIAAAVPLIQLLPLPSGVWTSLPGRADPALALQISGIPAGWSPLSLTPDRTWRSFLALIPPVAMALGVMACRPELRLRLVHFVLLGAVVAIFLGTAQLASGDVQLYPWATTSPGDVVGPFANRNHLATLCLISVPFAVMLGGRSLRRGHDARMGLWLAALMLGMVTVALAVIRSRTGVVLFGPTLVASLAGAWLAAGRRTPRLPLMIGLVAVGLALAVVAVFALGPLIERFDTSGSVEGRFENWPVIMTAASTYLPLGSGLGSFDAVFRSVEPLARLDSTFLNQAHNEYIELWLETGWLGLVGVILFAIWFGRRSWTAWRAQPSTSTDLQRAASVAIGVFMLHSFVDYPLRTSLLAVVFALCCALLELGMRSTGDEGPERVRSKRRRR